MIQRLLLLSLCCTLNATAQTIHVPTGPVLAGDPVDITLSSLAPVRR